MVTRQRMSKKVPVHLSQRQRKNGENMMPLYRWGKMMGMSEQHMPRRQHSCDSSKSPSQEAASCREGWPQSPPLQGPSSARGSSHLQLGQVQEEGDLYSGLGVVDKDPWTVESSFAAYQSSNSNSPPKVKGYPISCYIVTLIQQFPLFYIQHWLKNPNAKVKVALHAEAVHRCWSDIPVLGVNWEQALIKIIS